MATPGWRERFEAFAAKKAAAARRAVLTPLRTEIDHADRHALQAIGSDWTRRLFDGPFYLSRAPGADCPAANLVFVQSRDGNTVADDPSSLGGGETDQHLVYEGLSRVAADAVLAGARTARGSGVVFSVWHPEIVALRRALGLPRHPAQIVATLGGLPLDAELMFNVPELRVFVITTGAAAQSMRDGLTARPWITPIVMNSPEDLGSAFAALRREGIGRVSVVGGRSVAATLLDRGFVQDLCLTTSPRAAGEPGTPLPLERIHRELVLRKRGTGPDEGVVFEQYLVGVMKSVAKRVRS